MSEIAYTNLPRERCAEVVELLDICFPHMTADEQYSVEELQEHVAYFPEGVVIALHGEMVVGMGIGIFVDINFDRLPPTEEDLLFTADQANHNYAGAYYYGSDMAVHPAYRGRGIAREIYNRRKQLAIDFNKKGFAAAAVLRDFHKYKDQLDVDSYVERVVAGDIFDPTLSVQLRNGFEVIRPIKDFFPHPPSDHWSALILWKNPHFQGEKV